MCLEVAWFVVWLRTAWGVVRVYMLTAQAWARWGNAAEFSAVYFVHAGAFNTFVQNYSAHVACVKSVSVLGGGVVCRVVASSLGRRVCVSMLTVQALARWSNAA